jgi:hypothetical protein
MPWTLEPKPSADEETLGFTHGRDVRVYYLQ